ncbi:MAG: hypothetical protein AB8H80_05200 [Planctomycetota bacterium]
MSGHASDRVADAAAQIHPLRMLTKPFSIDDVQQACRAIAAAAADPLSAS